jgi:hypothetical protein
VLRYAIFLNMLGCQPCARHVLLLMECFASVRVLEYLSCFCGRHVACLLMLRLFRPLGKSGSSNGESGTINLYFGTSRFWTEIRWRDSLNLRFLTSHPCFGHGIDRTHILTQFLRRVQLNILNREFENSITVKMPTHSPTELAACPFLSYHLVHREDWNVAERPQDYTSSHPGRSYTSQRLTTLENSMTYYRDSFTYETVDFRNLGVCWHHCW